MKWLKEAEIQKICDDFENSSEGISLAEDLDREGPSARQRIMDNFNDHRLGHSKRRKLKIHRLLLCPVLVSLPALVPLHHPRPERHHRPLCASPRKHAKGIAHAEQWNFQVTAFIVGGIYFKVPIKRENVQSLNGAFFAAVRGKRILRLAEESGSKDSSKNFA